MILKRLILVLTFFFHSGASYTRFRNTKVSTVFYFDAFEISDYIKGRMKTKYGCVISNVLIALNYNSSAQDEDKY